MKRSRHPLNPTMSSALTRAAVAAEESPTDASTVITPDRSLLPLVGSIHFGRPQGDSCDYITIEITDELSRVQFVEARIKYADFAHAITGHGDQPVTFALRGIQLVGTRAEYKGERVPFDCYANRADQAAKTRALAPFEVDGWKGSPDDLTNGHCTAERGFQRVTFRRHVNATTGQPVV